MDTSAAKVFEFKDITTKWGGYISSVDRTNVAPDVPVRGSQNMYKKLSGNWANRPGQKRLGVANATLAKVTAEYSWNTSWGENRTMVVANSILYAVVNNVWYQILAGLPKIRYIFDKWYDATNAKDDILFVCGNNSIQMWSGGLTTVASVTASTSGVITALANGSAYGGSGYLVGDIITISGGSGTATCQVTSTLADTITSFNLGSSGGGSGYHTNDQLFLVGGTGTVAASVIVDTVDGSGTILTFHLYSGGSGYGLILYGVTGGHGTGAGFRVASIGNGGVYEVSLISSGTGYSTGDAATTNGSGTGAHVYINSITTAASITKQGTTTWQQEGFTPATSTIIINGLTYTYTGGWGTGTITGVTPDPTAGGITAGMAAVQSVVTTATKPNANFNNDFIKVINNQVYVGSYSSHSCYISSNSDYTDYTVPTPRLSGSPEFLTLDGSLTGIGVKNGNAWISVVTGEWAEVTFQDITVGTDLTQKTVVNVHPVALLQAALAHEFIDNVGDNIIFLSQDQQVRSIGNFNDSFTIMYPSLSQDIATELTEENFTGGGLQSIGEFIYITAPVSGKTYLYQARSSVASGSLYKEGISVASDGRIISERLWHTPFVWNATRIDQINGVVVAFSNANPQIYQVWDTGQWHDDSPSGENLPYTSILALGYRGESRRQGLWSFDKTFTEGYITAGTPLDLTINYNYQGATSINVLPINSVAKPATLFQQALASLGENSLGDEPLGQGGIIDPAQDPDAIPKFKVINSWPLINCFEWQPVFSTDIIDSEWEILAFASNARPVEEQNATFIINK